MKLYIDQQVNGNHYTGEYEATVRHASKCTDDMKPELTLLDYDTITSIQSHVYSMIDKYADNICLGSMGIKLYSGLDVAVSDLRLYKDGKLVYGTEIKNNSEKGNDPQQECFGVQA